MRRLEAEAIGVRWTLYDLVDQLYGEEIDATLNEWLIKGCLDFLDEGQSAWQMPGRRQGLFQAWSQIAKRNRRWRLRGLDLGPTLETVERPEAAIDLVMTRLGIPERLWMDYFTLELSRLHGWAGFVRWRSQAKDYYWQERYPADLVDFIAIRLVLSLPLIEDAERHHRRAFRYSDWVRCLEERPHECLLRHELHSGAVLPDYAHRVEVAIDAGDAKGIEALYLDYEREKTAREAASRALRLRDLCELAGMPRAELATQPSGALREAIEAVYDLRLREGNVWMQALERTYIRQLLQRLAAPRLTPVEAFARTDTDGTGASSSRVQALFCIDVRSERLRRQIEGLGHYETFGVAGFFGVPVSFIELGKGHETALCPAIVTPRNVVLEMPRERASHGHRLFHLATEVVHDLKATVLAPFITVEAVGLLFGFDMVGKTVAPTLYDRWRKRLNNGRLATGLMIDKLSEEDAVDLVANLQDELVVRALDRHFGIKRESVTTGMIQELREIALGRATAPSLLARHFDIDRAAETVFVTSLRLEYRLTPDQARIQLEQLARIGFRIERQAQLVRNTLGTIGLTGDFARIVLVVGHGSSSCNNPYESALDCGACGGDKGLVNARLFAAMANRREVRERLADQGISIPEDTWFIPALHDTTTDETALHDLDQLPPGRLAQLTRIREDLAAAGRLCARERCAALGETGVDSPGAAARRVKRNALDWTQVRPEWGLSGNASFIVGRRDLTRGVDLEGRAFLHSYDHRQDASGALLEAILSGPLIVAQWINLEHYFSVVDNRVFGSGSKVYHNVVGRFGVMTGNVSDLRTGLPAQTMLQGERPYHQPVRLIAVIDAPLTLVQDVLSRVFTVRQLVENGWIRLLVLDRDEGVAHLFEGGSWVSLPWMARQGGGLDEAVRPPKRPRKRSAPMEALS
jgi:hypothetical protein